MTTEPLDYRDGDTVLKGAVALPAGDGKAPGIAVFSDIGGIGAHTYRYAEDLAALGYVALAADSYGDGLTPDFQAGMPLLQALRADPPKLAQRARAAIDTLLAHPRCDGRTGAIGFCFGGSVVLELARHGHPAYLSGVSFHGDVTTPQPATAPFAAKLLVCHGAEDPLVPDAALVAFLREMAAVNADCQTIAYTGAVHSFTNRQADGSMGFAKYDEPTARRSWNACVAHFAEVFG